MNSMIELAGLTKVFGTTRAVDDLTCSVEPGMVTGFLGPNGAGKTTTMRLILGLDHPTAGTATIDGRAYRAERPAADCRGAAGRQAGAPEPVGA
jgi:ABC-2 type transport system ATP-binding protein